MALAICGQQNRAAMRRRVARTPKWCIACSASLCWMGTSGRNTPVETSPSSVSSPTAWVVICSVVEFSISTRGPLVRRRRLHGCWRRAAQGVRHHVFLAWCVSDVRCEFGDEGELSLLAGRPRRRGAEQGCDEWLVVGQ
jgi:hypothetical protein